MRANGRWSDMAEGLAGRGRADGVAHEADELAAEVARLTGLPVRASHDGAFLAVARALSAGHGVIALEIQDAQGTLRARVPSGPTTSPGRVALVVSTMVGLRQRFPWAELRRLECASGMQHGRAVSGWASSSSRAIHLVASEVRRSPQDRSDDDLVHRLGRRPGGMGRTPWPVVVVAHECWHRIEFGFQASRRVEAAAFQRELGAVLGLQSLERAFGGGPGAAEALARIRGAVGDYATTKPVECTAELFAAWWCGDQDPLVLAFGELVERHLPAR